MALSNIDLIEFFKQRMVELYDNNTLDSYCVRTCNTMSMFYELREMLGGWIACNVKRGDTVARCIDECIMLLDFDEWMDFSFYDRRKLITNLEDYKKKVCKIKDSRDKKESDNSEARYVLHLVSSAIAVNDNIYLAALISSIHDELLIEKKFSDKDFSNIISKFDMKISLFATELLRRGYSKSYLFFFFKSIKKNKDNIPFQKAFEQMQSKFKAVHLYQDTVIIRMNFNNKEIPIMENMFEEVPTEYMNVLQGFIKGIFKKETGRRFYIVKLDAVDTRSALQKARLRLSQALDRNNISTVHISNTGVVLYSKDDTILYRPEKCYEMCSLSNSKTILSDFMYKLDGFDSVTRDIKDRLNTALRHLRVGDEQTEVEQRFLNYWIGLEFIFSTPKSGDSTFSRLMEKLPKIMTLYYLKRNISDLDLRLREKKLLNDNESFGSFTQEQMDKMFEKATDILLKYRIKIMKSNLHSHEKIEKYLKRHEKNLQWHLSRIYHYRNELVHEAAIKQNVESITINLRSYLVFMLNLLLDYCNIQLQSPQNVPVATDNFFWYYELLWLKCTPEYDKDRFLELFIPEELVR